MKKNMTVLDMTMIAIMAALCYIGFTFFKINIPVAGGTTAIHFGNTFCVLAALMIGGWQGGLAGAIGMGIGDLLDPLYITSFPKTFLLKFCIGLFVGLVAHKLVDIKEMKDTKKLAKWVVLSSMAGMAFNVICEPVISYLYKTYLLGVEADAAKILATWTAGATFINAITSVVIASLLYLALRKSLSNSSLGKKIFK